jgi:hypothetical protein
MRYGEYQEYLPSLEKLLATSLLPFEDLKAFSPFMTETRIAVRSIDDLYRIRQLHYVRIGNENKAARAEQRLAEKEGRDLPEVDIESTEMLSPEGLTVEQIETRHTELNEILDKEIEGLTIPQIGIRVIKALYDASQERREKDKEKEPGPNDEPYFNAGDIGAYIAMGLTDPEG